MGAHYIQENLGICHYFCHLLHVRIIVWIPAPTHTYFEVVDTFSVCSDTEASNILRALGRHPAHVSKEAMTALHSELDTPASERSWHSRVHTERCAQSVDGCKSRARGLERSWKYLTLKGEDLGKAWLYSSNIWRPILYNRKKTCSV